MANIKNNQVSMKEAKVMECVCSHSFQDQKHGKQKRVHNPNKTGYKCTVCGRQSAN